MRRIRLDQITTVYDDGRHNAFTSIARWRGRYWLAFRQATSHRALDGRIAVISSPDLLQWSDPVVVIDTPYDDRDPSVYVWRDMLFVSAATFHREWQEEENPWAGLKQEYGVVTTLTATRDGADWEPARPVYEPDHFLWWALPVDGSLYGSARLRQVRVVEGREEKVYAAKLVRSEDGRQWETVSVISAERLGSETALAALPDGRLLAFVRHDAKGADGRPELKVARPPYLQWEPLYAFDFLTNGPCLGIVDGTVVASGRAFFEDPQTPLVTPEIRPAQRGLLVMTVDPDGPHLTPQLLIPHEAPAGRDAASKGSGKGPDISYAGIVDLGGGRFAMSYYDGLKDGPAHIKLAFLSLV